MIRLVVPDLPPVAPEKRSKQRSTTLFRHAAAMMKAEAWQTAAAIHDFKFDPSAVPDPPNSFTTAAGRLARTLFGYWETLAEPVPQTITAEGMTETTWPKRSGVPLFAVETREELRRIYLSKDGFITARFPLRRVEVSRYGRYTTGVLGGRVARAVAEALGGEQLQPAPPIVPWPVRPPSSSPYSLLARTMITMARAALDATAPELRVRMDAIDFDGPMDEAIAHLTVDEVHAL